MSSQISHEWLVDGQSVDKQNFRDEIDKIAAEMNHGGFYRRVAAGSPDTLVSDRLFDQYVSAVADFGAPVNYTPGSEGLNAAPAINNAIDAVVSAWGGGTVYLPPGVFWISSPIVLRSNVRLLGAGMRQTTVKLTGNAACHVITHSAENDVRMTIQHLTVDGNWDGAANRRTWYDGINIRSTIDAFNYIADVHIRYCGRDGLHMSGGRSETNGHNIFASDCNRYGFYIGTYDNQFTNIQAAGTGADTLYLAGGPNRFACCKFYFAGNGSMRYSAWPNNFFGESMLGSTSTGFDNTAPQQGDWYYGAGIRNNAAMSEFVGVEIQDTWGPGFVEENSASETRFNGIIGNVGDLAPGGPRHSSAGWPDTNDRFSGTRACVEWGAAYDCYFDFTTRAQDVRYQTGATMCNYIGRSMNPAARNIKLRVLAATTNTSGVAATHVSNLSILESAPKHPTVELSVNAL